MTNRKLANELAEMRREQIAICKSAQRMGNKQTEKRSLERIFALEAAMQRLTRRCGA